MGIVERAMSEKLILLGDENERLRADVERERMRNIACGVVARADTPESKASARVMHDDYKSDACDAVAERVDECIRLRAEVAVLRDALIRMRDSTHTSAAVLRGMADFELQKAARRREER